MEGP
ncbi:uncharacterized protein FFM5_15312 [Fusarium fujikuroi]|jgi:hypothetical protein